LCFVKIENCFSLTDSQILKNLSFVTKILCEFLKGFFHLVTSKLTTNGAKSQPKLSKIERVHIAQKFEKLATLNKDKINPDMTMESLVDKVNHIIKVTQPMPLLMTTNLRSHTSSTKEHTAKEVYDGTRDSVISKPTNTSKPPVARGESQHINTTSHTSRAGEIKSIDCNQMCEKGYQGCVLHSKGNYYPDRD
jgi:hypothetical protein